jgi:hypothetical protein
MRGSGDASIGELLKVENGLIESSLEAYLPKGLYIARTLVLDCWKVPVRVLSATRHDQKLTKGSPLAHCEQVTLVTSLDVEQPQVRDTTPKLQDVIAAAKPNLSDNWIPRLQGDFPWQNRWMWARWLKTCNDVRLLKGHTALVILHLVWKENGDLHFCVD